MSHKMTKVSTETDLVQHFLNLKPPSFEDWCYTYSMNYPLTRSLREKARAAWQEAANILEQQRQEETNRRKVNEIKRAKTELEAALEEVRNTLPEMVEQLRQRIEQEKKIINKPFSWADIEHPLVNGEWVLHFNDYECWTELSTETYNESPDEMRSGSSYSVWVTRERGAGSYWTNSLTGDREFFVSRAKSKNEPAPEIIYPHCTLDDFEEIKLYKELALKKRQQAQEWIQEAEKALDTTNLKWILTTMNYPLYLKVCRAVRTVYQLKTQSEISSKVREVLANLT